MKVVILAGGKGTRVSEETLYRPKPMIEIGGMPIIWHLMKIYAHHGFNEFIICLGYKKEFIIEYFENNSEWKRNKTKKFKIDKSLIYNNKINKCKVTLVNTGLETMTGGRLKRIKSLIKDEMFLLTYGDTLSDVNIIDTIKLHKKQSSIGTLTAVHPISKYGVLTLNANQKLIKSFKEKPIDSKNWINGGFYVFEPDIFNYLKDDYTVLEEEPLEEIVKDKKFAAFKHKGFWSSLETYKDKLFFESLWNLGEAKWNVWEEELKKVL